MKQLLDMTEPELRDFCNKMATGVEAMAEALGVKKPLFALLLFDDPRLAQYVANCDRSTMVLALREAADRLEKRQDVTR